MCVCLIDKVGEHADGAGTLPEDEPEVCVKEGGAVLPEALSTNHREPKPPAAPGQKKKAGGEKAGSGDGGGARSAHADHCAEHAAVLHAHGGATVEAAAEAAYGCSYAPLFVPSPPVLAELRAFFGLGDAFPHARLVARSPTAKTLLLLSDEVTRALTRALTLTLTLPNLALTLTLTAKTLLPLSDEVPSLPRAL